MISSTNKDDEFDFKFAASLFLNGEYAIRHFLLSDDYKTEQNVLNDFKNNFFSKLKSDYEQLILQALIDYTLYRLPNISSPAFSKLYWERYITKCNKANIYEVVIENFYDIVMDKIYNGNILIKICNLSLTYGFYITDILFFEKRKFNFENVCTSWLLENHINQLPKCDLLTKINKIMLFYDESEAFTIFEDSNNAKGHVFILDFDNEHFDISYTLHLIEIIYTFYKLDKALFDKIPHRNLNIKIARKIIPKILERINQKEIFTKMIAIEIYDYIYNNNIKPEEAIDAYYKENKCNAIDGDIMPAVMLAIKSIKEGKLCTSKDK